jgi:hypothetical protein
VWGEIASAAQRIRESREKQGYVVNMKKVMMALPDSRVTSDTVSLMLSGALFLHGNEPVIRYDTSEGGPAISSSPRLDILFQTPAPYSSMKDLKKHLSAYLQLLAVLPEELLACVTPENALRIAGVVYDNTFGIRSVDVAIADQGAPKSVQEDPGSELLGWGLYPEASLFNHSCDPTITKARHGRQWRFWTSRDLAEGQEVCIT